MSAKNCLYILHRVECASEVLLSVGRAGAGSLKGDQIKSLAYLCERGQQYQCKWKLADLGQPGHFLAIPKSQAASLWRLQGALLQPAVPELDPCGSRGCSFARCEANVWHMTFQRSWAAGSWAWTQTPTHSQLCLQRRQSLATLPQEDNCGQIIIW